MTASAGPALKRLHREFGEAISFATLYVREAHPGDHYPQPRTFAQKLGHARAYRERDGIPWPILIDDVQGTLHRTLNAKPGSLYLMDLGGRVAFRSLWANDAKPLREALAAVARGQTPATGQDEHRFLPILRALGGMYEVLSIAGPRAKRDALRRMFSLYLVSRFTGLFRPLPPLGRSMAAAATTILGLLAAGLAVHWLGGRSRRGRAQGRRAAASA